jgi:hypothetical protein
MAKFLFLIVILFLCNASYSSEIPQGFAPIDTIFHGSPTQNIKLLEPRNKSVRDGDEGSSNLCHPFFTAS